MNCLHVNNFTEIKRCRTYQNSHSLDPFWYLTTFNSTLTESDILSPLWNTMNSVCNVSQIHLSSKNSFYLFSAVGRDWNFKRMLSSQIKLGYQGHKIIVQIHGPSSSLFASWVPWSKQYNTITPWCTIGYKAKWKRIGTQCKLFLHINRSFRYLSTAAEWLHII